MLWISKTRVDLDDAPWPRKLDDAVWPRTHPNSILRRQSKMFLNALMVLYISVTGGQDVRGRSIVVGLVRIGALQRCLKVVGAGLYRGNFGRHGDNGAAAMAACERRS